MNSKYSSLSNLRTMQSTQPQQINQFNNQILIHAILANEKKKQLFPDQSQNYKQIKLHSVKLHHITTHLQKLYQSTNYQNASLFGFNIRSLQKQLSQNNTGCLTILWTLFQTLNWENISLKNIQQYLENFPLNENQVQQIQIQNNKIKLFKLDMCLQFDPIQQSFNIVPKNHQFNRFIGKNYKKSITKITDELNSYQFKDTILQIESNDIMTAVRIASKLFIINADGKMKSFSIPCLDVKVSGNRCYFSKINQTIGSLFMQTLYTPKLNDVALEDTIYRDSLKSNQFLVSDDKIVAIVQINIQHQYLSLRRLEGNKYYFRLNIQTQHNQNLVSKKSFIQGNYLYLFLIFGFSRSITKILQYKFYLSFI